MSSKKNLPDESEFAKELRALSQGLSDEAKILVKFVSKAEDSHQFTDRSQLPGSFSTKALGLAKSKVTEAEEGEHKQ